MQLIYILVHDISFILEWLFLIFIILPIFSDIFIAIVIIIIFFLVFVLGIRISIFGFFSV
jgi:hypothetical protein